MAALLDDIAGDEHTWCSAKGYRPRLLTATPLPIFTPAPKMYPRSEALRVVMPDYNAIVG
jgi:hypothetical protein